MAKHVAEELKVPFVYKKDKNNIGAPNHVQIDISKYKKEFKNIKFTNLKNGLKKTIIWHKILFGKI